MVKLGESHWELGVLQRLSLVLYSFNRVSEFHFLDLRLSKKLLDRIDAAERDSVLFKNELEIRGKAATYSILKLLVQLAIILTTSFVTGKPGIGG